MQIRKLRAKVAEESIPSHSVSTQTTVELDKINGRPVKIVIEDGLDLSIVVGCAPGERDTMTFSLEQWHALERRVLEGLMLVADDC